jgi:hypothetical protein
MNAAWDEGITLFDTARSYGFGEAEGVLGEFLRGRRSQAVVATKFGIAPQRLSTLRRGALPLLRVALKTPGVRKLSGRSDARTVPFGLFTAEGLRRSLESSLRELDTDYVDILFLHEASASAVHQQDLMGELEALIRAGKVLRAGLYAGREVIAEGISNGPAILSAMQFGADPFDPFVAGDPPNNQRELLLIANHPFGGALRVARMRAALLAMSRDAALPAEFRDKLDGCNWPVLLEAILGMILNGTGIHALVFSMMQKEHLRANARAVACNCFSGAELALMRERLLGFWGD